jgi:hypothetical protein
MSDPVAAAAAPVANFFAFDSSDRGGVRVAIRDVNNDGHQDLVVASGTGDAAQVTVYSGGWTGGAPTAAPAVEPFGAGMPADGVYVG